MLRAGIARRGFLRESDGILARSWKKTHGSRQQATMRQEKSVVFTPYRPR